MAVSFPIDLYAHFEADSAGGLKVVQRQFRITDPRAPNETIGGDAIITTYGTNLWYGTVSVVPLHNALQRKLEAKVRSLLRNDARFFIGDVMDDPLPGLTGTQILGSVNTTNNHRIRIDGFPVGFIIDPGVRIAFDYEGGRRAFHEIDSRGQANANGQITLDVFPILQPGWELGTTITIGDQAKCKAYLLPNTLQEGNAGADISEGFTFQWRQTLEI